MTITLSQVERDLLEIRILLNRIENLTHKIIDKFPYKKVGSYKQVAPHIWIK